MLDQIGRVAPVTSRRMFGGVGLYSDGLFFALVDDDRLYLKVDDTNRRDFVALGAEPFRPLGEAAKPMAYYELPGDLLEDHVRLGPWVEKAVQVARSAAVRRRRKMD